MLTTQGLDVENQQDDIVTRNYQEFNVDENLYRSKSAPRLFTGTEQQQVLPQKFRASKLPTHSKDVLDEFTDSSKPNFSRAAS